MLSTLCFANNKDLARLQKQFGHDLTKAPFFLRFAYYKEFNKDWKKSDFLERKEFLTQYEINLAKDQARDKEEAKEEAAKAKELWQEKKDALRNEKERLKEEAAQEKAEQQAEDERQKEFNAGVIAQQRNLQQMQRAATQLNQ